MVLLRHIIGIYLRNIPIPPGILERNYDYIFFALSRYHPSAQTCGYFFSSEFTILHSNPSWENLCLTSLPLELQSCKVVHLSLFAHQSSLHENHLLLQCDLFLCELPLLGREQIPPLLPCPADTRNVLIIATRDRLFYMAKSWPRSVPAPSLSSSASSVTSSLSDCIPPTPVLTWATKSSYSLDSLLGLVTTSVTMHNKKHIAEEKRSHVVSLQLRSKWNNECQKQTILSQIHQILVKRTTKEEQVRKKRHRLAVLVAWSLASPDVDQMRNRIRALNLYLEQIRERLRECKRKVVQIQTLYAARRRALIHQLLDVFPIHATSSSSPSPTATPASPQKRPLQHQMLATFPSPVGIVAVPPSVDMMDSSHQRHKASICGIRVYRWSEILPLLVSRDARWQREVNVSTGLLCQFMCLLAHVVDLPLRCPLGLRRVSADENGGTSSGGVNGFVTGTLWWTVRDPMNLASLAGHHHAVDYVNHGLKIRSGGRSRRKKKEKLAHLQEREYFLRIQPLSSSSSSTAPNSVASDTETLQLAFYCLNMNVWALREFYEMRASPYFDATLSNLKHLLMRRFPAPEKPQSHFSNVARFWNQLSPEPDPHSPPPPAPRQLTYSTSTQVVPENRLEEHRRAAAEQKRRRKASLRSS